MLFVLSGAFAFLFLVNVCAGTLRGGPWLYSRLLFFVAVSGGALLLPRVGESGRRAMLLAVAGLVSASLVLICASTGGSAGLSFQYLWAMPLFFGLLYNDEPLTALTSGAVCLVGGLVLLVVDARLGSHAATLFVAVTLTSTTVSWLASGAYRRLNDAQDAENAKKDWLFEELIRAMPAAVFVVDKDGRPRYSNPRSERLLGRSADPSADSQSLGERYQAFVAGTNELYPSERMPVLRALRGETAVIDDMEVAHPDGRRRLEVWGAPVRDGRGELAYALAMFVDTTERHRAAKELEAANTRLAQADRISSLGTLAAGVAHEINNPLAFISTNVSFALEELEPLADARVREVREALKETLQGVFRVRDIVRDLKLFSRSNEDKREPTDVRSALESAIALSFNEIRHRARLERELDEVPLVLANEPRLVQVFVNLLTNAAQAIPEGHADANSITVRTRKAAKGRVVVEVVDTGDGIPPEVLPRIFEPFFTTKPIGVGTGLGLAICHGIIKQLGGELEVETAVGKGTTFRLHLPAAAAADAPEKPKPAPAQVPSGVVVAVIDDDALVGASVRRLLGKGWEVRVFTEAREALDWLSADTRCDAVLCDLMMPQMTGMDFHAQLQQRRPGLAKRVVFATGGAFTPRSHAFFEGAVLKVEKPFDPAALRSALSTAMAA